MITDLKRLAPGDRVSSEEYNRLCDAIEWLSRFNVASPLQLQMLPSGPTITCPLPTTASGARLYAESCHIWRNGGTKDGGDGIYTIGTYGSGDIGLFPTTVGTFYSNNALAIEQHDFTNAANSSGWLGEPSSWDDFCWQFIRPGDYFVFLRTTWSLPPLDSTEANTHLRVSSHRHDYGSGQVTQYTTIDARNLVTHRAAVKTQMEYGPSGYSRISYMGESTLDYWYDAYPWIDSQHRSTSHASVARISVTESDLETGDYLVRFRVFKTFDRLTTVAAKPQLGETNIALWQVGQYV